MVKVCNWIILEDLLSADYVRDYVQFTRSIFNHKVISQEVNGPSGQMRNNILLFCEVQKILVVCLDDCRVLASLKTEDTIPSAHQWATSLLKNHQQLKAQLEKTILQYKIQADKHQRTPEDIQVGDYVFLSAKNLRLDILRQKLGPKKIGPRLVIEQHSDVNFWLNLPEGSSAHDIFHISLLSKFQGLPSDMDHKDPPPIILNHTPEWEVEDILNHCTSWSKHQYLVKWKGYKVESNSWEPEENLENTPEILSRYKETQGEKSLPGEDSVRDSSPDYMNFIDNLDLKSFTKQHHNNFIKASSKKRRLTGIKPKTLKKGPALIRNLWFYLFYLFMLIVLIWLLLWLLNQFSKNLIIYLTTSLTAHALIGCSCLPSHSGINWVYIWAKLCT